MKGCHGSQYDPTAYLLHHSIVVGKVTFIINKLVCHFTMLKVKFVVGDFG
jgi:hypothetical protein